MTTPTAAPDLIHELREEGFTEGPPRHLHAEYLMDDIESYSTLECAACGQARQRVTPYHRGRAYRLLCECRACGHATEM